MELVKHKGENVKLKVEFTFWLFIGIAALFRQGYFALNYAIAVVLHEVCHYLVANRLFYRCTEIKVSMFGAVLYGDFENVTPADRIKIAIAGPLCNVALATLCLALWWMFPESYYYTESFFTANVSIACVNMLPCYPLDGGRILTGLLENKLQKKSLTVTKYVTVILSLTLFGVFVISLFTKHNLFSLGLFAICLFCGTFSTARECYVKTTFAQNKRRFIKKGMEKKTLVFYEESKLRDVAKRMQGNFVYCLDVVNADMELITHYTVSQLEQLVITESLDTPLKMLKKF
ncbi:MAG: site-2 protease family protein [Clostridia bacterium]|nr:site-2 protease family protein [Clostridia bacterium]